MIERELEGDINENKISTSDVVTAVDYGSNYGYFSLHMAQKFRKGTVVSLEGEAYSGKVLYPTKL